MNRKTILALAIASAFGLSAFPAYADDEQKETEKPQLVAEGDSDMGAPAPAPELIADGHERPAEEPKLIADEDKKDEEKPQLVADSHEKETEKPQITA